MKARLISTQTTVKEGFIPHPNYGVVKGMYGYWETKKNKDGSGTTTRFCSVGRAIQVKQVLLNMETVEKTLRLVITDLHGMETEVDMPRALMTEYKLTELVKYGAQVSKDTAPILICCLEN